MLRSIVEYYSEHESYKCGYCKKPDTNFSHGMWAHSLTVGDYQDLIDRGWRRSGKYCYKPTMDVTCCPMYTIRCAALEFKATKSQKKVMKRFNKYLVGSESSEPPPENSKRKMSCSSEESADCRETEGREQFIESRREHQQINIDIITKSNEPFSLETHNSVDEVRGGGESSKSIELRNEGDCEKKHKEVKKGTGLDPTKTPCKKAKHLRRERKLEKLKEIGVNISTMQNTSKNKEKQLEDFINEVPDSIKQKLEIVLVRTNPPSREWLATAKESHELYVKYQTIIHNDEPEKCTEVKFTDFLVSSPLLEEYRESGPPCGYGSFHQQYRLDGRIIAVGVVDILPKCVSSVYFFYDPQYMHLTLGTYGALREINFVRNLNAQSRELKYYYMGYYIHSCKKMRYKGNFCPSDLACPETYKWFPLKDCIPKLEVAPYSRLDPDVDSTDENYPADSDINYIPVLVERMILPYKTYLRKFAKKKNDDELKEYARLVGRKISKSLILVK